MTKSDAYMLKGIQLWPSMFFTRVWQQHELYGPELLELVGKLQLSQQKEIESEVAVAAKSAHGLVESNFDLFQSKEDCIRKLVQFIRESLALAVCVANNQEAQPQDVLIEFVDSWYHVTSVGGFHDAHVHHGCSWCGIYYLQIGESGRRVQGAAPNGGSRFYCPINLGGGYRDFGNKYLSASVDPHTEDGLLLLFPSYLMHSGLPYWGETDRVVFAFNARVFLSVDTK